KCLSYDVTDPDGKSLVPLNRYRNRAGETRWVERFSLSDWKGGDMLAELKADWFGSAELSVTVDYDDGLWLKPLVAPEVWTVGEPFKLNACLRRPGGVIVGESMELTATIITPDGNRAEAKLFDDGRHDDGGAGDGIFGRSVRTIDIGKHTIEFRAECRVDNAMVEREVDAVYYAINPNTGARFAGKPTFQTQDYDKDGLYDALSIGFPVNYPKGLKIAIHARLEDARGRVIHPNVTVMAINMVQQRDHVIAIGVESGRIVEYATDGRFFLKNIRMWDKKADTLADVLPDVSTEPYTIKSFDSLGATPAQPR
ncbi:MAG: choice-of-anchor X domain-containing protein, partial [Phycisphaerae bacterium]